MKEIEKFVITISIVFILCFNAVGYVINRDREIVQNLNVEVQTLKDELQDLKDENASQNQKLKEIEKELKDI